MIKKFYEYINESESKNIILLNKVSKYITRRFKNDDRTIFTYWIGLIFGFTKYLFISKVEMSENLKDVIHAYAIIGDKYYDGSGFHTREDIYDKFHMSKWSFNDYTFSGDLNLLEKCVKENNLKLNGKLETEIENILLKYKKYL